MPTMGTGTVLILAKEKGLIKLVEKSLRKLQDVGLWVSDPVIQMLKNKYRYLSVCHPKEKNGIYS